MKSALRWLRPFDVIYGRELRTATYKRKRSQWAAVAKKNIQAKKVYWRLDGSDEDAHRSKKDSKSSGSRDLLFVARRVFFCRPVVKKNILQE